MYIGAQSILSIRLRRRGTDLALASDALAPFLPGRVEDHPPAPPGSAEDLERYHESSFALNCVEETPCAPILLRLLQLRNGVVLDARAPCAADAWAAPPNADELLDHLKTHPSVLLLGVSDDVEQSLKVGDRSIDSTNTDAEERRLVCAQLGGEFSDDVDQSVILAAAAAAAAASIEADPRASVAPAAAAAAAAARKAEAAAAPTGARRRPRRSTSTTRSRRSPPATARAPLSSTPPSPSSRASCRSAAPPSRCRRRSARATASARRRGWRRRRRGSRSCSTTSSRSSATAKSARRAAAG